MSDEDTNTEEVNKKISVTDHDEVSENNDTSTENDAPEENKTATDKDSVEDVIEHKSENEPAPEAHVAPTVTNEKSAPKWNDHPVVTTMKSKHNHYNAIVVVLLLLVVGFGAWAYTLSSDNKDLKKQVTQLNAQVAELNANPQATVQKQTDDLIAKIGLLTKLPTGEAPTVAVVSDAAQAKQQSAFFTNAQNGDKTLIYVKAGEAILYRPSTNKVILVAPFTISNTPAATTTTTKH